MKILVIRFSSIGDIILTTPVLTAIKTKYPNSEIDFVTLERFKDAISGNKNIDKLILFNKEKYKGINGIYKFSKTIKSNNYDIVIDLHSKMRSKILTKFISAKTYRYKKRSWWKTLLVKMRIIKYEVDGTIVNNYFGAVKKGLGVIKNSEKLEFDFTKKDLEKVEKYKNSIIFAPGASKETKKWPKEYFGELGKLLLKNSNKKIILIGSKKEYEELEVIKNIAGKDIINLAGKLSLKESGALMSQAEFVLTNDSGPFHIARGVRSKVFAIFGPTAPNMFEYDEKSILIYENTSCSPCSLHGDAECPKKHFDCMKKLTAKKVFYIIKSQ